MAIFVYDVSYPKFKFIFIAIIFYSCLYMNKNLSSVVIRCSWLFQVLVVLEKLDRLPISLDHLQVGSLPFLRFKNELVSKAEHIMRKRLSHHMEISIDQSNQILTILISSLDCEAHCFRLKINWGETYLGSQMGYGGTIRGSPISGHTLGLMAAVSPRSDGD